MKTFERTGSQWILMVLGLLWAVGAVQGQISGEYDRDAPVFLKGSLGLTLQAYQVDGIDPRRPALTYVFQGNPVLSIKGFDVPLSLLFSNFQQSFRQPFNKFGLSVRFKFGVVHLGHRNVRFNPYTLNGHTFLGAGIELNPGILRLGAVYGRFLKAVQEDTTFRVQQDLTRPPQPAFRRTAYAVKLGIGRTQSFLDVIFLRGADDPNSLDTYPLENQVRPAENAALGLSGQATFGKRVVLSGHFGASAFTRDRTQDTLSIEDASGLYRFLRNILEPRFTSQLSLAGDAGIGYRSDRFTADARYRRIDPGYKSMGAYYFQTDIEELTAGVGVSSGKGTFRLQLRGGVQRDNIRANKNARTSRLIASAVISLQPSQRFGCDIQFANFGVSQEPGLKSVSDTTMLRNINRQLIVTPRLLIPGDRSNHLVVATFGYNDLNDKNDFTRHVTEVRSTILNGLYSLQVKPWRLQVSAGYNWIRTEIAAGITRAMGFQTGANLALADQKIRLHAQYLRNANQFEGERNGFTARIRAGVSYAPAKTHQLSLTFSSLHNDSRFAAVSRTFTERSLQLAYLWHFNTRNRRTK